MEFFASPDQPDPQFESFLEDACKELSNWFATTNSRAPLPLVKKLPNAFPGKEGLPCSKLLADVRLLMEGSYQPSHPGALAHLDPPPITASIVGELIAAGLNNNLLAEELSPSVTKIERTLCKWFTKKLGMPETGGGVTASGGSLANLMALLVARSKANLQCNQKAFVLVSSEAHVSISRAISVMGLPPDAVCNIPTDHNGCLSLPLLKEEYINQKSQDKTCFAVIATAGTTIRGAIDPLCEISDFCKQEGLWFHIDAAIGGVFALSSSTSKFVDGISMANSVVVNPQKILGISKTSSLLLVSQIDDLYNCFSTGFPYIEPSSGKDFQGGEIGLQGTRSAEILKLWLGLRQLGQDGIRLLLEESIMRRQYFYEKLDSHKFNIISGPFHLIAFSPKYIDSAEAKMWSIATKERLLKSNFMLSRPTYKTTWFLKAVMGNPHTKFSHLDFLADAINKSI